MPIFQVKPFGGVKRLFLSDSQAELEAYLTDNAWNERIKLPLVVHEVCGTRAEQLDWIMQNMQENYRGRWCESARCGCMGCANGPGALARLGFEKSEWEVWVSANQAQQ
jgi:hypothetical protein